MSDSFFDFDTTLPSIRPEQFTSLEDTAEEDELEKKIKNFALESGEEFEVYDYEQNFDRLGDQLEEAGDDLNDETFGDVEVGEDFDFTTSNAIIAETIQKEEKIYVGRKENTAVENDEPPRQSLSSLWSEQPEITINGKDNSSSETANLPVLPESPISPSIWGSFHPPPTRKESLPRHPEPKIQGPYDSSPSYPPQQASPLPPGFGPPASSGSISLEEIEEQLQRKAGQSVLVDPQLQRQPGPPTQSSPLPEKRMLSLAEVEAAMLGMSNRPPQIPLYSNPEIVYREQEAAYLEQGERKRRERQRKLSEMARYNGLMTQYDKDYINRIQISQLLTDDPYSDDFYCQVYTLIRNRQMPPFSPQASGSLMSHERGRHRSRGSEDARRKPKSTQLSLEGALGKIALNSVRNPRQLLQMSAKHSETHHQSETSHHQKVSSISSHGVMDRRKVLRSIENVYSAVLGLEELRRNQPPLPRPYADHEREAIEKWNEEYSELAQKMWEELCVTENFGISYPHPFISILSISKGKKVIPRVLPYCLPDQILTVVTMLVANFETLDVCKGAMWAPNGNLNPTILDEVELFMDTVVPPLLQFIAESSLQIVSDLLTLFIERNNIVWCSRSKVGLIFLAIFLSRVEILKQGGGAVQGLQPPEDRELIQWQELYNRLFSQLQNQFLSLFPPLSLGTDDMYVWKFLAAIAVGASHEQQHVLVTEVRERVLETVVQASRLPADKAATKISHVNLFLHALGLDASQINLDSYQDKN